MDSPQEARGRQLLVFIGLTVTVTVLTTAAHAMADHLFAPFIGGLHPLLVVTGTGLLGIGLFSLPWIGRRLAICGPSTTAGVIRASLLALAFAVVVILADLKIGFPANLNVPFPSSLLFYPVIAFVVEVALHVLPMAILFVAFSRFTRQKVPVHAAWLTILFVATLEPGYQVFASPMSAAWSAWAAGFVAIHVFAFNVAELVVFWRYDFISMFALRLVYYLLWHVGWGSIRLRVLF